MEKGLFEPNEVLNGIYIISKLCTTSESDEIYEAYTYDENDGEVNFYYLLIHKSEVPMDFTGPISGITEDGVEYWGQALPRELESESSSQGNDILGQLKCNVEFKTFSKGRGFADVAGMDELKAQLKDEILYPIRNPKRARKYRLRAINGMLLWGPPGCGKTFISEKFAEESHMNYALVKASDLACVYGHGSQTLVADLFNKASQKAPCVICIDEIEAMIPRRSTLGNDAGAIDRAELCNEFLTQLNNCADRGIFVVATTNNPHTIDPAVLRSGRLEETVYVPAPDVESRKTLLEFEFKGRPTQDIDLDALTNETSGYIASDITKLVNRAALIASKSDAPITMELMRQVLQEVKPSLSATEIRRYELLRQELEGGKTTSVHMDGPTIGFTSSSYGKRPSVVASHSK